MKFLFFSRCSEIYSKFRGGLKKVVTGFLPDLFPSGITCSGSVGETGQADIGGPVMVMDPESGSFVQVSIL